MTAGCSSNSGRRPAGAMREAAKAKGDNRFNYGSELRKGAPTRGKKRGRAFRK